MYFKGEYEHTIDAKGRVFVPAKFREGLGEEFVVCKGFFDECLYVFSNEEFEEFSDKLNELSFTNEDAQIIERELYTNAVDVSADKQGRALIPQKLRSFAKIDKEVSIVGVRNHIEIWDKEKWNNRSVDSNALRAAIRNLRASGVKI